MLVTGTVSNSPSSASRPRPMTDSMTYMGFEVKVGIDRLRAYSLCIIKSLEVNHYFKNGGSFWKMINPY